MFDPALFGLVHSNSSEASKRYLPNKPCNNIVNGLHTNVGGGGGVQPDAQIYSN